MILTSIAMFAFPKQLRGNRIPSPQQTKSFDGEKPVVKEVEEEAKPQLKGKKMQYIKIRQHSKRFLIKIKTLLIRQIFRKQLSVN